MIIEQALIRATAEYIRKARIEVEGYEQRRHGKLVHVRDYTRSMIKKLSTDDLARLLTHPEATTQMKMAAIEEYTRRSGGPHVIQHDRPQTMTGGFGGSGRRVTDAGTSGPMTGREFLARQQATAERRSALAQQPKVGPPKRLRGRTSGGPKMTAARRRSLPVEQFGLPESRSYPLDTPGRARNAKVRAKQQLDKGNITQDEYDMIIRRADMALPPERTVHRPRHRRSSSTSNPFASQASTKRLLQSLDKDTGQSTQIALNDNADSITVSRFTGLEDDKDRYYVNGESGEFMSTGRGLTLEEAAKRVRELHAKQGGDPTVRVPRSSRRRRRRGKSAKVQSVKKPQQEFHGTPKPGRKTGDVSKPTTLPPLSSGNELSVGYLKPGMELLDVPKSGTNQIVKRVRKNEDGSITVLCESGYTFMVGGPQDPGKGWYVRVGNIPENY